MTLTNRRVLYISYNGMLDPLGQSQVIPYLKELSREGVRFTLLSFEGPGAYSNEGLGRCEQLRAGLAGSGIDWCWLRYHQTPSLPATIYDVLAGIRYGSRLVRLRQIEMIHARSHIAATIALALKKRFRSRMIFDLRGLMAEEYVDADHWRKGSVPYLLTKSMERRALQAADGVVTLTEKIWPMIKDWEGLRGRTVVHEVVPCCADLERFRFRAADRDRQRNLLGVEDQFVLVYSGSVGGWYLADKMADFFMALLKQKPDSHFLWLSGGPRELIERLMLERGVSADRFSVRAVAPAEVSSYLCAADAGIAFYKPTFSRLATSPVKVAEYLACGLPVIINAGVGDSDTLISAQRVGAVITDFSHDEYEEALQTLAESATDETRARARQVAEQFFDLQRIGAHRYARLYEEVLGSVNEAVA